MHKRSCPSPPQSKWITIACWCPSTSRPDRTTTTTHDDDFDLLACHANHHLNAKTVLGCCAEYFLWHFSGGLHDFRRGTCAFFAVSTLRSRVSLKSVHIRFSCRDRDPIKADQLTESQDFELCLSCEDAALTHTPSMIDQVQKYVTILLSDKNPLRFGRCVMQKRFEKLNSFKSQFDFGIVHKRSCPSPPQSKWITIACWCPSASRHANHHLDAKTVLGCCAADCLWHFCGGLHDFRGGTCAFFAVSTLRSRVSLKSVHIRFSCRDRDPIKADQLTQSQDFELWGCGAYRYPIHDWPGAKVRNHLAFRQESLKIWQMCDAKKIRKVEFI